MKGLLHSKRFKANLRKWLLMYVGVMGLLTTVITYSKYISSLMTTDESRVTKFNVSINFDGDEYCTKDNTTTDSQGRQSCSGLTVRPSGKIVYRFSVDVSELEVNSVLNLTIKPDEHFNIDSIKDITDPKNPEDVAIISKPSTATNAKTIENRISAEDNQKLLSQGKRNIKTYEVTVKWNKEKNIYENGALVVGIGTDAKTKLPYYKFDSRALYYLTVDFTASQEKIEGMAMKK